MMRQIQLVAGFCALLFFSIILSIACAPNKKPLVQSLALPPLKTGLPGVVAPKNVAGDENAEPIAPLPDDITTSADFYALAIANGNWALAKNMSTETNKLIMDQQIRPRLNTYWREWQLTPPHHPVVNFETSLLVSESYDDQVVLESIRYTTKQGVLKTLYLQFRITKIGKNILINDTLLFTPEQIHPGD